MSRHDDVSFWPDKLGFASVIYLAFLAYPLILGRRAGRSIFPHLAAVLASASFFFQARSIILELGLEDWIGLLPVIQALLMLVLFLKLLRVEPPGTRAMGRLALVAGAALAFVTVAIPLQLEKEWITIGWALEGAALVWLFRRIPHRGLLYTAAGLFAAVFVRLVLNPSVLVYAPRGESRIWNWYLYTYLVSSAAFLIAGRMLAALRPPAIAGLSKLPAMLFAGGTILLFVLLNIEIADFYSVGSSVTFRFSATLAEDMTYTLGWAVFAVALLSIGIAVSSRPARIAALGLLIATILKCFLHDLGRLGGLYRVMSFVGLAICLALVAVALQRFVLTRKQTG